MNGEKFSVDEIYACSFDEFCKRTHIPPDTLIRALRAEIAMLKQARSKYRTKYMSLMWDHPERDYYDKLLLEITRRIEQKTLKLQKYLRYTKGEKSDATGSG